VGEIWVAGPSVALGYWAKLQLSASTFQARLAGDNQATAYLRTGDLGFLWQSELFVTGRIKELVIVGGRNLYPQDIEHTLQESNPAFRSGGGAAFALTQNGQEHLVVLQEVNRAAGQADHRLLAAEGARAIAARHGVTPLALVLVAASSIPKTSSGKIQRTEARQMYREGNFVPLHTWQAGQESRLATPAVPTRSTADDLNVDWHSEIYTDVQAWVAEKLDVEPHHIDLDVTFSDLGVNSVEAVALVHRLQDRIERTIPAIELLRYPTAKALIDHLAEELHERALAKLQQEESGASAESLRVE
jgi:acyl carrier protein